jgi:hypothetical protein
LGHPLLDLVDILGASTHVMKCNIGAAKMSRNAAHEQVYCSFCGKSQQEVRNLIEGGCRNPALSECVFICDECVTFSAQVIADLATPNPQTLTKPG